MLSLKQTQIDTLDTLAEARFVMRLCEFVRQECQSPEAFRHDLLPADEPTLQARVRERLAVARGYGLRDEQSLAAFMALSFTLALNFDEAPQFQGLLRDASLSPPRRMEKAFQLVVTAEAQRKAQA